MDFNVEDFTSDSNPQPENIWLAIRQTYVDILAAGFSKDEAMQLLMRVLQWRMAYEAQVTPTEEQG